MPEVWRLWHLCYPALDGLAGRRAGFEPVGRKEVFELILWRVVHEFFKDPLEVSERVGSVATDLLDESVDDRAAPTRVLAADKHPVLVAELGGTDGVSVRLLSNRMRPFRKQASRWGNCPMAYCSAL